MFAIPNDGRAELRRTHERAFIRLPTQLYLPAEEQSQNCQLLDLSMGGAQLQCDEPPPLSAFVILNIEGFGRFEAVSAWFRQARLGLRFVINETRRKRLAAQIEAFRHDGVEGAALCGLRHTQ
jgi:hypothetical protein